MGAPPRARCPRPTGSAGGGRRPGWLATLVALLVGVVLAPARPGAAQPVTCDAFATQAAAQAAYRADPVGIEHLDPEEIGIACRPLPCPCDLEPVPIASPSAPPPPPSRRAATAATGLTSFLGGTFDPATGTFYLKTRPETGPADLVVTLGPFGGHDRPILGDWDGDGRVTAGVFDPERSRFYLRNSNTSGPPDAVIDFGPPVTDTAHLRVPVVGDWLGQGVTSVGYYDPWLSRFVLRLGPNRTGAPQRSVVYIDYGNGAQVGRDYVPVLPVTGDWRDSAGNATKIALYVPAQGRFLLKLAPPASGPAGRGERRVSFGEVGGPYEPLAGDWDGDGKASPGLYRYDNGTFSLTDTTRTGIVRAADLEFRLTGPPEALRPGVVAVAANSRGSSAPPTEAASPVQELGYLLLWLLALQAIWLAALPLTLALFRPLADRGGVFARPVGLVAVGWAVWLLGHLRLVPVTGWTVAAAVALLAALAWRDDERRREAFAWLRRGPTLFRAGEVAWLAGFLAMALVRAYSPDIVGSEKPQGFLLLNTMVRGEALPPEDPWLAGYPVNYYYFGSFLIGLLCKLTGVPTAFGFNLGSATLFGLLVAGAFSLGANLVALGRACLIGAAPPPENGESEPGAAAAARGSSPALTLRSPLKRAEMMYVPAPRGGFAPSAWGVTPGRPEGARSRAHVHRSDEPTPRSFAPAAHRTTGEAGAEQPASSGAPTRLALVGGALAAVLVALIGNLEGYLELLKGRGLAPAPLLDYVAVTQLTAEPDDPNFVWWARASRVISDLEPATGLVYPVLNDFPLYSYLVGDLHPHIMASPVFLTVAALGLALVAAPAAPGLGWLRCRPLLAGLAAVLVGSLGTLNSWDFPSAVALLAAARLVRAVRDRERFALGRALALAAGLLVAGTLLYLPFYLVLRPPPLALLPVPIRTRPVQFLLYWGQFLVPVASLIALAAWQRGAWPALRRCGLAGTARSMPWSVAGLGLGLLGGLVALLIGAPVLAGLLVLLGLALAAVLVPADPEPGPTHADPCASPGRPGIAGGGSPPADRAPASARDGGLGASEGDTTHRTGTPTWASARAGSVGAGEGAPGRLWALTLAGTALLLIATCEVVFVNDVVGTRLNTVFKLYYEAWPLLACAAAYAIVAVGGQSTPDFDFAGHRPRVAASPARAGGAPIRRLVRAAWTGAVAFGLIGGLLYTVPALLWNPARFAQPPTLDGNRWLRQEHPGDAAAIDWLRRTVSGAPRTLEARGEVHEAYHGRVASNTGLPTLLAWVDRHLHYRGPLPVYGERAAAVDAIFRQSDPDALPELLARHQVEYVVYGEVERQIYGELDDARYERFAAALGVAYDAGNVVIFGPASAHRALQVGG